MFRGIIYPTLFFLAKHLFLSINLLYKENVKEILKAPLEIRGKMKYSAHEAFFRGMLSMNDGFIDLFFTFYVILSDFRRSKVA
jgi:hypothetical protein